MITGGGCETRSLFIIHRVEKGVLIRYLVKSYEVIIFLLNFMFGLILRTSAKEDHSLLRYSDWLLFQSQV